MKRSSLAAFIPVFILASASQGTPPRPDHVVIVIEENHSYSQIIGSPSAPYMNALATAGASCTSFYAVTHPSQPNYLHLFSGSNQGITNDTVPPAGSPYTTPNLGAAILAGGFTFGGYSEDLPAVGSTVSSSGSYMRKHNPWVNWQASPQGANQLPPSVNMPFTSYPADYSTLPAISFVVPNQLNDMHDGTITQADTWLSNRIGPYAAWTQLNNSLLIVTWDEDNNSARNRIANIFYGPMVTPGQNASTWTHHNLLRTLEDMYGLTHSGKAADVQPITGIFTTDVPTAVRSFQNGVGAYAGEHDTWIEQTNANTTHGSETPIAVDSSPLSQGLVRFDDIVGGAISQIPPSATVVSAKLLVLTGSTTGDNSANNMSAHRMEIAWSESSTWNSLGAGVSTDNVEAAATPDFTLIPNVLTAWAIFDVTGTIQAIANGTADNDGWLLNPGGSDNWRCVAAEAVASGDHPMLSVTIDLSSCRPIISQPPANQHVESGQALTMSVTASATTPLTYQWRKGGSPLSDGGYVSGANSPTLTIDPADVTDSGAYDVIVTSNCGPVTSSAATATVCPGPVSGDMDGSGTTDGLDIEPSVNAVLAGSTAPSDLCAGDYDGSEVIDLGDVDPFADALSTP